LITQDQKWQTDLSAQLREYRMGPLMMAHDMDSALDVFYSCHPHMVLLDLHLPHANPLNLCMEMLLAQSNTKIVLVTEAYAEPPLDLMQAGISGCVDRNTPLPAWPGLLLYLASGGTIFDRHVIEGVLEADSDHLNGQILLKIGALQVDLDQTPGSLWGDRLQLTPREFALLACLVANRDRVVTFDQILNDVWGYDVFDGTQAQVRLYIARLRRKLLEAIPIPDLIVSERGTGYRLQGKALRRVPIVTARPLQHSLPR
jgi:DNA-binding response OmpR family regulator